MPGTEPKILISSCFLGNKVRYDGMVKTIMHPQLSTWQQNQQLIVICPEMAGGLPVPRPKAEQFGDKVIDEHGRDVSEFFISGAEQALQLCKEHNIRYALLKEFSPSCGSGHIYDGSFKGNKIVGMGITSKLLIEHGIKVFSELTIDQLILAINTEITAK
ncbi:DUF523 domain-containing protein [Thalassomonas sp. M1454]|uniref:DUF523 domain-containing protein n=1 Tax=Thalassomonas sp. M1454 TaxID=2594477 RepID=UPI00118134E9|nr:DUF523 domain-containing protein [Thalassomonas sp. M1454]TRX58052.1 DUF523 domain-containing protein [Thalassomonas sp. M1454]